MRKASSLISALSGLGAKCRYCGSTDVRPSKGVNYSSRYIVYRCNACNAYFKLARISYRHSLLMLGYVLFALLSVSVAASLYVFTTQEASLPQQGNQAELAGAQQASGGLNPGQ